MEAVIFIAKHTSFLHLSIAPAESALTHAEMDFRASRINLKIQKYLVASSHDHSVDKFAHFIMTTEIGLSILASFKIITHQAFTSIISASC